jgi:septum formation topological specificity factor MinE
MHASIAAKRLGLTLADARELGEVAIRSRAATLMTAAHPDTGGDPATAADVIRSVKQARDVLVRYVQSGNEKVDCETCRGRGFLRDGFRKYECPACRGTGNL